MVLLIQLTIMSLTYLFQSSVTTGEDTDSVEVSDKEPCKKGENHTLICKVRKRTPLVQWMKGNDVILESYGNECYLNPAYKEEYNYSCNPTENIFKLTILNVTENYNKRKLVCSDGTHKGCKFLYVADEDQRLEEMEKGMITATSACCASNASFKWIKIDITSNKEEEFKPKNMNSTVTDCSNECSSHSKRHNETISVSSTGKGKQYYLKVDVFYGTERIQSKQTQYAYMIEDQAEIETKHHNMQKIERKDHVGVVAAVTVTPTVIAAVAIIIWRKRAQRAENPTNPIVESESVEERRLNSVDTLAVTHQEKDDAKKAEEGEVMIQTVDYDNNLGSDLNTPIST